jgi:dCMP deaminase
VTVGQDGQILSQGYNGFPRNIKDTLDRLNVRETKLKFVVHAEMNCIYNACLNGVSLKDSTLYVYGLPVCSECCKGVVQVGIKRIVIYTPNIEFAKNDPWIDSFEYTKLMLHESDITYAWYDKLYISSRS